MPAAAKAGIRRWIIENDWLECIVALPDKLFFNTSIATYIWILTNRKSDERRGMIQLINGTQAFFDKMKRNLGDKSVFISDTHIRSLVELYTNFEENENCKIYPERVLRLYESDGRAAAGRSAKGVRAK